MAANFARDESWSTCSRAAISPMARIVRAEAPLAGHHVGGECVDRLALRLAVLERPEHVLQRLQLLDGAAGVARVQQRGEGLQQVAQLLGPLAQVVQVLGRRGVA